MGLIETLLKTGSPCDGGRLIRLVLLQHWNIGHRVYAKTQVHNWIQDTAFDRQLKRRVGNAFSLEGVALISARFVTNISRR
jgi:hypothetical protein